MTADGVPDHAQMWHEDGVDVTLAAAVLFGRKPVVFARQALSAMLNFALTDECYVGERYHDADPWY